MEVIDVLVKCLRLLFILFKINVTSDMDHLNNTLLQHILVYNNLSISTQYNKLFNFHMKEFRTSFVNLSIQKISGI